MRYDLLARASTLYTERGFRWVDVPWLLSLASVQLGCPPEARQFSTFAGHLPASAEQSFYEMLRQGSLGTGRWQTVTPCFRYDSESEYSRKSFMKLELIDVSPQDPQQSLQSVVASAREVLGLLGAPLLEIETEDGIDLMTPNGIEIGSYGIRRVANWTWVYGTGIAEPRFSLACSI